MYHFIPFTSDTYSVVLVIAAILPAAFLMFRVYRADRLEKESPRMLWRLVIAGIFSTLIALVEERVFEQALNVLVDESSVWYNVILYFGIVAFAEETSKYIMLRRTSWHSPEFNCMFDGVVYAVFVSLGFALWENISYVLNYGLSNALIRAVTAVPGHACDGVFMGLFYSVAKKHERLGNKKMTGLFSTLSVLVPAVLHGFYDYILSVEAGVATWIFYGFIAVLFVSSIILVSKMSKKDRYI